MQDKDKEKEMMSVIIDLMSRVSVLESLLLQKKVISIEDVNSEMEKMSSKLLEILEKSDPSK